MTKRKKTNSPGSTKTSQGTSKAVPRTRPARKNRPLLIASVITLALLLCLLAAGYLLKDRQEIKPTPAPTVTQEQVQVVETPVAHGATGKTIAQDQKDALAAATKLLNAAGISPTKADVKTRVQKLEEENFSVMHKSVEDAIRVNSSTTPALQAATYQALITFNVLYGDGPSTSIKPAVPEAYKQVYVDAQLGTAYVPLKVYSPENSGNFSFEMVYVDNRWKLAPYTLIDSIKLSAYMVERQREASPQQPTPTK